MTTYQLTFDSFGAMKNGNPMPAAQAQANRESDLNKDRIEPGRFNIVYADPPWRYANWSMKERAERSEKWAKRNGRSPYPVMNSDDIADLPVKDIAAKNAILLMWVTDPKLAESFEVIERWGFTYKTVGFTWVKLNPSGRGFHFGLGYHTRSNPEMCLLATRGKGLKRVDNRVPQLVIAPRGEHSRKPDIYPLIERLYGNVPKIELFARRTWAGWTGWGNEVQSGQTIQETFEQQQKGKQCP